MRYTARTSITQIKEDKKLTPTSAMWMIENNGTVNVKLNNVKVIEPGDKFGVDVSHLLIKADEVCYDTSFDLTFETESDTDATNVRSALFYETNFIKD